MNEQAITNILEGVIRNVMKELNEQPSSAASCVNTEDSIPVELSARHVHLSEKDAIELFGAPLTPARELSQPGQFLCKERVRLIGPKGVIDNVAILGPSRNNSQVEVSMTDVRALGAQGFVRQSGDIAGTSGIILASQTGLIALQEGLIVAARHIHMSTEDAKKFEVADNDMVSVRINGARPVVLEDVLVRVNDNFRLAMHIDSDEGNSSGWSNNVTGKIVAKKCGATYGCCKH